ncbi:ACT domain-containing protein [Permianibacter aggregans]|uniref:Uncharacterized protein n=1 Tax=Permianibacter aggregans TaxID=1510150 RepID=A0A4R6UR81_9GAMM|nr:ACT domain-containing protein [Permianibacter aggregans]QGX40380.1 ACT domain-containing protein [Permianibacter aggregans]TDQ49492.1 hypothetical protein EV696_104198 [Permianibacter aggregans]
MTGEKNLRALIRSMAPALRAERYVFVSIAKGEYGDYAELKPLAAFLEDEGMTLILEQVVAANFGFGDQPVFRCISLTVHSSLEAVGLTAAVATALAEQGISANVVAAYYHDHIFVPERHADKAVEVLNLLSRSST